MTSPELEELFVERDRLLGERDADRAQLEKAEAAATVRTDVQREINVLNAAARGALRNWAASGCSGDPPPVDEEMMFAAGRKLVVAEQIAGAAQGAVVYVRENLARVNDELVANRVQRESCVARLMADEFEALGNKLVVRRQRLIEAEDRLRAARQFFRDLGDAFHSENGARHPDLDAAWVAANSGLLPENPHDVTSPDIGDVRLIEAEYLSRVGGEDREVASTVRSDPEPEEAAHVGLH